MALDKGVKGTHTLQRVFKQLSRPKPCSKCNLCETEITEESCFEYTCVNHSDIVGDLSCDLFISTPIKANSDSIFYKVLMYVKLYLFVEFSLLNASSFYIMSLLDCISHYI